MVSKKIREAIFSEGEISFARFMEIALYCPFYGYYERENDTVGRSGDFYTSASVSSLFGELLAFQFVQWFSENVHRDGIQAKTSPVQFVESGAHDGRLAADILSWLQHNEPDFFQRLEYWIVEPSILRQQWQRRNLQQFVDKLVWVDSLNELSPTGVQGVIFSNELLDAMPRHRLAWDAINQTWFEWGVTINKDDTFGWTRMSRKNQEHNIGQRPPDWPKSPAEVLAVLPDGFITEICPLAEDWWRQAAIALRRGKLVTVDYGLTAEQFFTPERAEGTLRAYHRHRMNKDLLANVGNQDITAHVNFTALQAVGESMGLTTELFCNQARFLTLIAERIWQINQETGGWTPARARQFQTLTHPEHLGRPFQVLVQSR